MKKFWHSGLGIKCILSFLIVGLPCVSFAYITRINVSNDGTEANNATDPQWGHTFKVSPDGKYVAFTTYASNIIPEDGNELEDVFLRNTEQDTTTLVSVSTNGGVGNGYSRVIDMSDNGRYVLFQSSASNLVDGDYNGTDGLYMRDTVAGVTTKVDLDNNGQVAYGASLIGGIAMTPDARYILFYSNSTNLVANDNNEQTDIFVRDRMKGTTTRVNVSSGSADAGGVKGGEIKQGGIGIIRAGGGSPGQEANGYSFSACGAGNLCPKSITPDGRYVIFASNASNLVPDDTNEVGDIFVRDLLKKTTTRVSLSSTNGEVRGGGGFIDIGSEQVGGATNIGGQADNYFLYTKFAAISKDGRYVTFDSNATNLVSNDTNNAVDVFKRDTVRNITTRESVATNGDGGEMRKGSPDSQLVDVSPDGRYILFKSTASNFVLPNFQDTNGNRDGFVRDTIKHTTTMATTDNSGHNGNEYAFPTAMTPDGRYVTFYGVDDNVFHNGSYKVDAFLKDLKLGKTTTISENYDTLSNTTDNFPISITPDGTYSLLRSVASNLVSNDNNNQGDIFLKLNKGTLTYTGVYNFEYPEGLKYKETNTAGTINVTFVSSGSQYSYANPLVAIAKAPSNKTIGQLQSDSLASFRKLLKQNFSVSKESEHTANGTALTQLHFSGRIGGISKTYVVSFINVGSDVYVVSVSGNGAYSSDINTIADTITRTRGVIRIIPGEGPGGGGEIQFIH